MLMSLLPQRRGDIVLCKENIVLDEPRPFRERVGEEFGGVASVEIPALRQEFQLQGEIMRRNQRIEQIMRLFFAFAKYRYDIFHEP